MKAILYWLFWFPNPSGRREYEARKARLIQLDFWIAEMGRLSAAFNAAETIDEKLRLDAQFWVAAKRFDKEAKR